MEAKESYYKINENDTQEFLKYELVSYASSYSSFEEKVLKCYEMLQYCKEKQIYGYVIFLIYNDYWGGFGQTEENMDYETLLFKYKNEYMKYLSKNNLNTNEIPSQEIEKYYRPDDLKLVLNGKIINEHSQIVYNYYIKDYEILYFQRVVDNIESIEKILYDRDNIIKIRYNNKIYNLHSNDRELKENSIPFTCKVSYLEDLFNATIKYDFDKNKIYIDII